MHKPYCQHADYTIIYYVHNELAYMSRPPKSSLSRRNIKTCLNIIFNKK